MITNRYFGSRVFHTEQAGCYVITDTLQGTTRPIVPGMRTDTYPRAGYPRHGGIELQTGTLAFRLLIWAGRHQHDHGPLSDGELKELTAHA